MYSITWIEFGKLYSISAPSAAVARRVFYNTRVLANKPARLWFTATRGNPEMVF
jgi:hypothetical protein